MTVEEKDENLEHARKLERELIYLDGCHERGEMNDVEESLWMVQKETLALLNVTASNLTKAVETINVHQKTIQSLMESQRLMCDYLQRWHGIDLQQALMGLPKFTDSESDHG